MLADAHAHRHRRRRFRIHPAALGDDDFLYLGAGAAAPAPLSPPAAPAPASPPAVIVPSSPPANPVATANEELLAEREQASHRARTGLLICLGILLLVLVFVHHDWLFGSYLWVMERLCIGHWD